MKFKRMFVVGILALTLATSVVACGKKEAVTVSQNELEDVYTQYGMARYDNVSKQTVTLTVGGKEVENTEYVYEYIFETVAGTGGAPRYKVTIVLDQELESCLAINVKYNPLDPSQVVYDYSTMAGNDEGEWRLVDSCQTY